MANQNGPSPRSIGTDPYLTFRFKVEIDSLEAASFQEVSGLTFEAEVERFREGGENFFERQLPGSIKFPSNLVLKRGIADCDLLWNWYEDVSFGFIERKDLSILLLDPKLEEERWRWEFFEACPIKWTGPQFQADAAAVAFESVELIHRGCWFAFVTPR